MCGGSVLDRETEAAGRWRGGRRALKKYVCTSSGSRRPLGREREGAVGGKMAVSEERRMVSKEYLYTSTVRPDESEV